MFNRSILVRGAVLGLLLAGLVALADGVTRLQLDRAVMAFQNDGRVVARVAGAVD